MAKTGRDNRVGPHDVAARVRAEFPGVEVVLSNVNGLEADFEVIADDPRPAYQRVRELVAASVLFNMHMALGHRSRKTKWWRIEP